MSTLSLFTAIPSFAHTNQLNSAISETIITKLKDMVSQISEQLQLNLQTELEKLTLSSTPTSVMNPGLFFFYFKIKESIMAENLVTILDDLSLLFQQSFSLTQPSKYPVITTAIDSYWEQLHISEIVRNDIISEFGMENKFEIITPVFSETLRSQLPFIKQAVDIMWETEEAHAYDSIKRLNAIKIFDGTVRAFSSQKVFGNIYIRLPKENDEPISYYLEHIVHETAHQALFAMQLMDPIILNSDSELFQAPIRKQKRPMNGIFHACFVLARMVRCFRKIRDAHIMEIPDHFYTRIENWYKQSSETVHQHAKLTNSGLHLFKTFDECAYG